MEWTVRGKGDFQPGRFVPVKGERLRLPLWCRELRAAGLALGASLGRWDVQNFWSGLREVVPSLKDGAHTLLS